MDFKEVVRKPGPKKLIVVSLLFLSFLLFLVTTNPIKLPVGWLILPFIWIFLIIFLSLSSLIVKKRARRYSLAATIAAAITLTLVLSSINQISAKDIALILTLTLLAIFYISKTSFQNRF